MSMPSDFHAPWHAAKGQLSQSTVAALPMPCSMTTTEGQMYCVQDNKGIPQVQRDLHQVEQLSRNLRAKTARLDAGAETIAATRLLAHEGLNTRK